MSEIIATQVYPWAQYYEAKQQNWEDHLAEILDQVKEAGLNAWEQSIESKEQADRLAVLLKERELQLVSIYADGCLHEEDYRNTVESIVAQGRWAKPLGVKYLICNPDPISTDPAIDKNDQQLATQASALQLLGDQLAIEGIQLSLHTHLPEFRQAAREVHHMLLNVSPDALGLCLDTHWIYRGSGNSNLALFDIIKLYGTRINTTHLRQSQNGIWAETFEDGDIDHSRVFAMLKELSYTGPYTFELAHEEGTPQTMSPMKAHYHAKEYLQHCAGFAGEVGGAEGLKF